MRNLSIRAKQAIWFSVVLVLVVGITAIALFLSSYLVLRKTVRDYLISSVEENVDNIHYVLEKGDTAVNSYIPYAGGYMQIDIDFLDVINDVHVALYTAEGTLLYGENPLSKQTNNPVFTSSRIWNTKVGGTRYNLYDRKINIALPNGETLWLRGVVPETKSLAQFKEIIYFTVLLLPPLFLLAAVLGYILSDRVLSPLRKIEGTMNYIAEGTDLKARIDVGRNNDEIGRLGKVFNSMLDRLERSFEAERRFTSDASHELRTPTSVILAQIDYTLEKERVSDDYVEALEVIKKQGERMSALIRDMLEVTRLDQNGENYLFEDIDFSELVDDTVDQMRLIGTKGVIIICETEKNLHLNGNRMLLVRLLQNLISNADRYGKENGTTCVSLKDEQGRIILSVADNGIGIAKNEQEKIFDRFYRGDMSRTQQGTGLGLSIVQRIAEIHSAIIQVESELDKGSKFYISFPR